MDSENEILAKIAGNVIASTSPCSALKFWRKRLNIKQIQLAKEMSVTPSVLSDYESGRRTSPGVCFVKKYVKSLIKLDEVHKGILKSSVVPKDKSTIIAIGEFKNAVLASLIVEMIKGKVLHGEAYLNSEIYGYTIVDSIKAIYALSGFDFYKIFGATTERALIFTKVGMGRSPLVAIRVSDLKPRMVVLHGPQVVDPLAIDLAEKEEMILVLSSLPNEESFLNVLSKI